MKIAILRMTTKHVNLWMRQLEMKRRDVSDLAWLMGFDEIRREIETEKNIESWAKRCSHYFTKKVRRMLYEEIDNMTWSGSETKIVKWCEKNKVDDDIAEAEIEILMRDAPDEDEPIRLTGKCVWEVQNECVDTSTHTKTSSASRPLKSTVM